MPEEAVRPPTAGVGIAHSRPGRRTQLVETIGRQPLARQTHAVEGPAKKSLKPAHVQELAEWLCAMFQVQCGRLAGSRNSVEWPGMDGVEGRINPPCGYGFAIRPMRASGWVSVDLGVATPRKLVSESETGLTNLSTEAFVAPHGGAVSKPIALHRESAPRPVGPSGQWSMDCMYGTLADGLWFQVLTVVDN